MIFRRSVSEYTRTGSGPRFSMSWPPGMESLMTVPAGRPWGQNGQSPMSYVTPHFSQAITFSPLALLAAPTAGRVEGDRDGLLLGLAVRNLSADVLTDRRFRGPLLQRHDVLHQIRS